MAAGLKALLNAMGEWEGAAFDVAQRTLPMVIEVWVDRAQHKQKLKWHQAPKKSLRNFFKPGGATSIFACAAHCDAQWG